MTRGLEESWSFGRIAFVLLACTALSWAVISCESDNGGALDVEPSNATMGINIATYTLTVVGGTGDLSLPLEWSVSNAELGQIIASEGYYATYARTELDGENVITVKDQYGSDGIASVNQVSYETDAPATSTATTDDATVSDDGTTTTDTTATEDTASGGMSDYVGLSVSGGEPVLSYLVDSGDRNEETSYTTDNTTGAISSYSYKFAYLDSGNTYDLSITDIERDYTGDTTGYTVSGTVTVSGETVTDTLTYP